MFRQFRKIDIGFPFCRGVPFAIRHIFKIPYHTVTFIIQKKYLDRQPERPDRMHLSHIHLETSVAVNDDNG